MCLKYRDDPHLYELLDAPVESKATEAANPVLVCAWRAVVSVGLHIYERGGHGFDLRRQGTTSDHWFDTFLSWLEARQLLPNEDGRQR